MFIRDIFAQKKPVLSFEVFPPKKDSGLDNVISAVDELSKMPIDYMSVTYGAGGSNSKNTAYIASHLKIIFLFRHLHILLALQTQRTILR